MTTEPTPRPCLVCGHLPCPCCVTACDLLSHPDSGDSHYCCDGQCTYTEEALRARTHAELIDCILEASGYREYWRAQTPTIGEEFAEASEWGAERLLAAGKAIKSATAAWWLHGLLDELSGDFDPNVPEYDVGLHPAEFEANVNAYAIGKALGVRLKTREGGAA